MSDNIGKMADGRDSFAFRGDRRDIWHRKGNQFQDGWTVQDWAKNSGLDFSAVKVPAFADLHGLPCAPTNAHQGGPAGFDRVSGRHFIVRSDNARILSPGTVTDLYQVVQPRAVLDWFEQYVAVDPRFQLDTAGALHGGETIWAAAVFNGDDAVAGERHRARLLMTTTFDGTGSTINRGLFTRVVCNNTLSAGIAETQPTIVRTRHSTRFDAAKVGRELAQICASFAAFKAMGDAMARWHAPSDQEVSRFFKLTLEIDPAAKKEDISARKMSQFEDLTGAYYVGTRQEDLSPRSGWAMIQAIARYADHNRSTRGSDGTAAGIQDARFGSAVIDNGGSGALMKARAVRIIDELMDGALRAAADKAKAAELAR